MTTTDPTIVEAGWDESEHLSNIIAAAFATLAVSRYLIPDDTVRERILVSHLGQLVRWSQFKGLLATDSGRGSAAVWLFADSLGVPEIPQYEQTRQRVCGQHTDRWAVFEDALHARHPLGTPHWYLALLAVRPELQGRGLGSKHLAYHHAWLDESGLPAYLEASDPRSRNLYLRHGYHDHGQPFAAGPGGPLLYPMWREPGPRARSRPGAPAPQTGAGAR